MVLIQLLTLAGVAFAIGLIISVLWKAFLALSINGILIYILGLRSIIEIDRGALEKYLFFGLLSFGLLLSVGLNLGIIWPLTMFLLVTFVGVKSYDLTRSLIARLSL